MGSYITQKKSKFIHEEDRCPSNTDESKYVCATYDSKTQNIERCPGHRNKNENRNLSFETYTVGSIIDNQQPNTIISNFTNTEINARKDHAWYKNSAQPLNMTVVENSIISHEQENAINNAIGNLNQLILNKKDYGISGKTANLKKINAKDLAKSDNLKYLEQNILSQYRDCICYSDCTCHGLSSWTETVWCGSHGSGY